MFNQEIILTKNECKSIIEMNNGFTQSKLGAAKGGYDSSIRSSYDSIIETNDTIRNLLLPKLSKYGVVGLSDYFTILKYEIGHEFKKHRDIGLNETTNKRYKTLIIQLSNFDDYVGGDLIVWDTNGKNETRCDKSIGNMILFPSKLLHQATPVITGTRYVITFFLTKEHFNIRKTLT
jgi:hypothetical protein|tara:strand:- start:229 stop:759 length:531 start_codon:yes stop_codon:yes gene_type:complete